MIEPSLITYIYDDSGEATLPRVALHLNPLMDLMTVL